MEGPIAPRLPLGTDPLSDAPHWEFSFSNSRVFVRHDSGDLFVLNPSAAYAWELLRSGQSRPDAIADFAAHFGIPTELAAHDLERTWSEWQQTLLAPPLAAEPTPSAAPPPADPPPGAFSGTYRVHGTDIRVVLHDPELTAEIAPRLEHLLAPALAEPDATVQVTASEDGYHVFSGDVCLATEDNPPAARIVLLQELVRLAHPGREWTAILHAGACGDDSNCVIFPAETHSGKTTLAAVLMHSGLRLYADDSVALEHETLTIPAMPFSLMIREGSWPLVSTRFPGLNDLPVHDRYGQKVKFLPPLSPRLDTAARASAIVFSQWEPGAQTTTSPLDSFEALVRLKDSGFWVAHDRDSIQRFLNWIESLPIYEMVYSDVDEAAEFVKALLAK